MGFGGEVDDGVNLVLADCLLYQGGIADVPMNEGIAWIVGDTL